MAEQTPAEKAAADKAAADKAAADKTAAAGKTATGAPATTAATLGAAGTAPSAGRDQAAQDQTKGVTDRTQQRIRQATGSSPFVFAGRPGQAFTIRGKGFGASGTVRFGNSQALTSAWGNELIRGIMPADAGDSGQITVVSGEGVEQTGDYPDPTKNAAAARTVVTATDVDALLRENQQLRDALARTQGNQSQQSQVTK